MPKEPKPTNDTTFEVTLAGGDKVEIGDRDSVDFKPHIKLNRWDGECFIKVQPAGEIEEIEYEVEENKIKCKYKVKQDEFEFEWETEFYPLEPTIVTAKDKDGKEHKFKQNELGGFEFEQILKKKPKTNKIVLDIETQGLKFHHQPPLHPDHPTWLIDELGGVSIRPENVVGGYAVDHATRIPFHKNKEDAEKYKACIAFFIYYPYLTDVNGWRVRAEGFILDVEAKTLTTVMPQDFLDKAVYPVSTGTTNFGFEEKGGTSYNIIGYIMGSKFLAAAGTPISVTAYLQNTESEDPQEVEYGVYLDSDASRVAYTGNPGANTVPGGHDANFLINLGTVDKDLTAADHYLVWWAGAQYPKFWFNEVAGLSAYDAEAFTDGTWPNPWTQTVWGDRKFTIFCTYEEEAAVGIPVQAFMHMQRMRRQG